MKGRCKILQLLIVNELLVYSCTKLKFNRKQQTNLKDLYLHK